MKIYSRQMRYIDHFIKGRTNYMVREELATAWMCNRWEYA